MLKARGGFTLVETVVTLVIMGLVGAALTKLMVTQSQFFNGQKSLTNARLVSRSATNMVFSDLRMVEIGAGVVAAAPDSITLRVPYRMGVICASTGAITTASFLPVDSAANVNSGLSGYAWRDTTSGAYTYVQSGVSVAAGTAATCTAAHITTLTGGSVLQVAPPAGVSSAPGEPIFLYQLVTYRFANSAALSGRRALWRRVIPLGTNEELVAPFDTTAKFRFFALNSATAQAAAPSPLTNLRGVELVLPGLNERPSRTAPASAPYTTAVWFKNRNN